MDIKQQFLDAYWEMVNVEMVSISKKATLTRTTTQDGWDDEGNPYPPVQQSVAIRAIFDQYTTEQATLKNAAVGDVMCLLPAKKLRMKPVENDIVRVDGKDYNVVTVETDAAGAGFTLQLRKQVL